MFVARPLLRLVAERNIDLPALLHSARLSPSDLVGHDGRITGAVAMAVLEALQSRLPDEPALGLTLARYADYSTLGSLGVAFAAGGRLRDVFARVGRFHALVSDTFDVRIIDDRRRLALEIAPRPGAKSHPQAHLFALGAIANYVRLRLAGMRPRRVVVHDTSEACRDAAELFFRAPVAFGSSFVLEYAPQAREAMLVDSDSELAAIVERALESQLSPKPTTTRELATWLETHLVGGEPSLDEGARALGTTPRSLQRRLKAENATWQRVVDDTRRELSIRYLRSSGTSLTEVAYRLGFADLSSFSRSFRKWYGMPASRYRKSG